MAYIESMEKSISLPVVFCDGYSEIDIGDISFYSPMDFTLLLSILGKKTGSSPHQISVFLDCPKKSRPSSSPERRRIPLTSKLNISSLLRQRDSFLLVMLKKSRKDRKRRPKKLSHDGDAFHDGDFAGDGAGDPFSDPYPEKLTILKRNDVDHNPYYDFVFPFGGFQNPEAERERCRVNMLDSAPPLIHRSERALCKQCFFSKDEEAEVSFHWCVHDAVTVGFRSRAGPVSRPLKSFN